MNENQQLDEVIEPARTTSNGGRAESEIEPYSLPSGAHTTIFDQPGSSGAVRSSWKRYFLIVVNILQLWVLAIVIWGIISLGPYRILFIVYWSPWLLAWGLANLIGYSVYSVQHKPKSFAHKVARRIIVIVLSLGVAALMYLAVVLLTLK